MKDRRIVYLVLSCTTYLGLMFAAPYLRVPGYLALAGLIGAFMVVQIGISRWFASLTPRPAVAVAVMLVSLVGWAAVIGFSTSGYARYDVKGYGPVPVKVKPGPRPEKTDLTFHKSIRDKKGHVTKVQKVKLTGELRPSSIGFKMLVFDQTAGRVRTATNLFMIFAASAFGYIVSLILRHPNIVLPVGALAAYIDVWTVLVGPTSRALEKIPHVVSAVSVSLPDTASSLTGFGSIATIGPADFIFLGMFFGAVYRLKMNPARTFWLIVPALTLGMLSVITGFPPMGLPALVLMGPVVIIANYRHFRLSRDEYIAIGVAAVFLAIVTIGLTRLMT